MNTIVVGAQWGDEGKGKIIDYFSRRVDMVVRFQGGDNAGHTVYRDGRKFVMHLVPSGILEPGVACVIAGGVVIDPEALVGEISALEEAGVVMGGRLFVSEQAHVIFPYHRVYDRLREDKKDTIKIGTTGRGIGPCYSDRALRSGMRMVDLYDRACFKNRLRLSLKEKNEIFRHLYGFREFDFGAIHRKYAGLARRLRPYVKNTTLVIREAIEKKRKILFEGAQGTMLDLDQGTYPFVTSSFTIAGGACVGTGLAPTEVDTVLGVAKAYTTRVGEGPFPTQFEPKLLEEVRRKGREYGATTGRPRRCGWFDAVATRHAARVNGLSELALTKLDVLDGFQKIRIAVAYRSGGKRINYFPNGITVQARLEPVYETVPGWRGDTSGVRRFQDLPPNARRYVRRLSELSGVPITVISVGTDREQIIHVRR